MSNSAEVRSIVTRHSQCCGSIGGANDAEPATLQIILREFDDFRFVVYYQDRFVHTPLDYIAPSYYTLY